MAIAPPPPGPGSLDVAALQVLLEEDQLPPFDRWHPAHCGHSQMVIRSDGSWWHEGRPILRAELVRLFSRILRREEDGSHVLVTPAEKLTIDVEEAPFLAAELATDGSGAERRIAFRLTTGDAVVAGPDHAITLHDGAAGPRPFVHVRGGLQALIARPLFYELAQIALDEQAQPAGVWSNGAFFPLDAA